MIRLKLSGNSVKLINANELTFRGRTIVHNGGKHSHRHLMRHLKLFQQMLLTNQVSSVFFGEIGDDMLLLRYFVNKEGTETYNCMRGTVVKGAVKMFHGIESTPYI